MFRTTVALLGLSVFSGFAAGAQVTLAPTADNTLFQDSAGTLSNGAGPYIYVGTNGGALIRRAVMQFDFSLLPTGSTINNVQLNLTQSRPLFSPNQPTDLHRITTSWGEGASNAGDPGGAGTFAMANDATWKHRFFPNTNWASDGGDFHPTPSGNFVAVSGANSATSVGMRDDVQAWHDGTLSNHGWLLKLSSETGFNSAVRYGSRDHPAVADRPALAVNFRAGGDANEDDRVGLSDFAILAANFNLPIAGPANGDFNRTGDVNIADFSILAGNYGLDLNPTRPAVPEPCGALIMLAGLASAGRRARV